MAPILPLLIVVAVAGGAAFALTRHFSAPPPASINEIEWLTEEFKLDPEQSRKIADLHAAYRPICADHCADIISARNRIETAEQTAALAVAEIELRQLEQTCLDSTQTHLQAVATVMDPDQGQRYLALIRSRISDHEHTEPFGLK